MGEPLEDMGTAAAVRKHRCLKVVIAAPKGGVGKTTLTVALLVSARRAGFKALGVGMDWQQTLGKWSARRQRQREVSKGIDIIDVSFEGMDVHDYRRLRDVGDYDLMVVDTPPSHSEAKASMMAVCEMADIILVPTSASGYDLDEVIPFRKEIAGDKSWFVLNNVNRRAISYQKARAILVKHGRLCPVDIPRLEAIQAPYMRGLSATDPGQGGSEWFEALWDFLRREGGLPAEAPVR